MQAPDAGVAESPLEIFGKHAKGEFVARISGSINGWAGVPVGKGTTTIGSVTTKGIDYQGMQQSAVNVKFAGNTGSYAGNSAAQIYMQTADSVGGDFNRYVNADSTLEFDIKMLSKAPESLVLSVHCVYPCRGEVKINRVLPAPGDDWKTIKVPLACLVETGMVYQMMNTPFLFFTTDAVEFNLGAVRMVPQPNGIPNDAVTCVDMRGKSPPALTGSSYNIVSDFDAKIDIGEQYNTADWGGIPHGDSHLIASINDQVRFLLLIMMIALKVTKAI